MLAATLHTDAGGAFRTPGQWSPRWCELHQPAATTAAPGSGTDEQPSRPSEACTWLELHVHESASRPDADAARQAAPPEVITFVPRHGVSELGALGLVLAPRGALPCALRFESLDQRAQWLRALTTDGGASATALANGIVHAAEDVPLEPEGEGAPPANGPLPPLSLTLRRSEETDALMHTESQREVAREQLRDINHKNKNKNKTQRSKTLGTISTKTVITMGCYYDTILALA